MDDQHISQKTINWIKQFIVLKNICPFAGKAMEDQKVDFVQLKLSHATEKILLFSIFEFRNCEKLNSRFLLFHELEDFESFIEMFWFTEKIIEELGFKDDLHVVAFHPLSVYEGLEPENPVNFANRSPYPMIHLLKKKDLKKLNLDEEEKNEILERNANLLEKMGSLKLNALLNEFRS